MNGNLNRLIELFDKARAGPAGPQREVFLAAACGDDAELLRRVRELLEADEQAGDFLKQPAFRPPPDYRDCGEGDCSRGGCPGEACPDPDGEAAGTTIDRYRLLEEIGEGGYGRVFRAEQTEPVHRIVALKLIKAGMDTREVVARFEVERQALALMDHPHIARVLDAGTTGTGRPYFVMELVEGLPVTEFCDRHELSTEARLQLFLKVCHAVQHAHQKGVIHRDLKPSNILVAKVDGEPEPKIIDFGVAKALGQEELAARTLLTAAFQIIGTPAYMSPEQADPQAGGIDIRSDIYSLGVLLYELLTGAPPFDAATLQRAALGEVVRLLRETDPPKPSTRLRALGGQLAEVARRRQTAPSTLARSLHGDLDWIVMRAIEKQRARRYQSVGALADDIGRHLSHQPVSAGPPSRAYRVRKFVRRHRFGSAMAVAAAVAVLASLATLAVGLHQAKHERDRAVAAEGRAGSEARRAEAEAARAEAEAAVSAAVNAFLLEDLLVQASPEEQPDRDVKLRTLVDRAAEKVGGRFANQPWMELETRLTLSSVYRDLGEFEQARVHLDRAKEICGQQALPATDARLLRVRMAEARLRAALREYPASQSILDEIIPALRQAYGEAHPETLRAVNQLVLVCRRQGQAGQARALLSSILPVARQVLGSDNPETLRSMFHLAAVSPADEARQIYERVIEAQTRVLGPDSADTLRSRNNLNAILEGEPMLARAEELQRVVLAAMKRVLGENHVETLWPRNTLAQILEDRGKLAEAAQVRQEALELSRKALGPEHPDTVREMRGLAEIYRRQGSADDMARLYGELLSLETRSQGQSKAEVFATTTGLALLASSLGDWPRAAEHWQRRIALADDLFIVHRCAALAALMAGDSDGYAKECNAMLAWVARGAEGADGEVAAETSLAAPHPAIDLATCARLAEEALRRKPNGNWTRLVKGMAEYRSGEVDAAHRRFQDLAGDREASVALTAHCFLALSHHRLGNGEAAKAALATADRSLAPQLRRGESLGREPGWCNTAAALAVRAEAERAVFGREVSPKVDMASLAAARAAWRPVKEVLQAGKAAALAGEWAEAAGAFGKALEDPGFDWGPADAELADFCNWMAVAFARVGDQAAQVALAERLAAMLEGYPVGQERLLRAAKVCVLAAGCPPEMIELSCRLLTRWSPDPDAKARTGWAGLHWALLEYRRGDYSRAIESACVAEGEANLSCRATAKVVHAMAAKRLGRDEDFRLHLQRAACLAPTLEETSPSKWEMANVLVFRLLLDEAERLDPQTVAAMRNAKWLAAVRRGRQLVTEKKWQEAVAAYDEAIGDPTFDWLAACSPDPLVWQWVGLAHVRAGDGVGHLARCRQMAAAIEGTQDQSLGRNVLRACLLRDQPGPELLRLAAGIHASLDAVALKEGTIEWHHLVSGMLDYRRERFAAAMAACRVAAKTSQMNCRATALLQLAMAAKGAGAEDEARRHYRDAVAMLPELERRANSDTQSQSRGMTLGLRVFELLLDEARPMFENEGGAPQQDLANPLDETRPRSGGAGGEGGIGDKPPAP